MIKKVHLFGHRFFIKNRFFVCGPSGRSADLAYKEVGLTGGLRKAIPLTAGQCVMDRGREVYPMADGDKKRTGSIFRPQYSADHVAIIIVKMGERSAFRQWVFVLPEQPRLCTADRRFIQQQA